MGGEDQGVGRSEWPEGFIQGPKDRYPDWFRRMPRPNHRYPITLQPQIPYYIVMNNYVGATGVNLGIPDV